VSTKEQIIGAFQQIADATEDVNIRIGYGAPGEYLINVLNEREPTGQVWDESVLPTPWVMLIEALVESFNVRKDVSGNYIQQIDDSLIGVTSITPPTLAITLMTAAAFGAGRYVTIKDEQGNAAPGSDIQISVSGGGTIDGAGSYLINAAYGCVTLYSNGTQWNIVSTLP